MIGAAPAGCDEPQSCDARGSSDRTKSSARGRDGTRTITRRETESRRYPHTNRPTPPVEISAAFAGARKGILELPIPPFPFQLELWFLWIFSYFKNLSA